LRIPVILNGQTIHELMERKIGFRVLTGQGANIDSGRLDAANAPRAPSRRNRSAAAPRRRALGPTTKIDARLSTGFRGECARRFHATRPAKGPC